MQIQLNATATVDTDTQAIRAVEVTSIETGQRLGYWAGLDFTTEDAITDLANFLAEQGYDLEDLDGFNGLDQLWGTCTGEVSAEIVIAEAQLQDLGFHEVSVDRDGDIRLVMDSMRVSCECAAGFSPDYGPWTARDIGQRTPCCDEDIIDLCREVGHVSLSDKTSVAEVREAAEEVLADHEEHKDRLVRSDLHGLNVDFTETLESLAQALEAGEDLTKALVSAGIRDCFSDEPGLYLEDGQFFAYRWDTVRGDDEGLTVVESDLDQALVERVHDLLKAAPVLLTDEELAQLALDGGSNAEHSADEVHRIEGYATIVRIGRQVCTSEDAAFSWPWTCDTVEEAKVEFRRDVEALEAQGQSHAAA